MPTRRITHLSLLLTLAPYSRLTVLSMAQEKQKNKIMGSNTADVVRLYDIGLKLDDKFADRHKTGHIHEKIRNYANP